MRSLMLAFVSTHHLHKVCVLAHGQQDLDEHLGFVIGLASLQSPTQGCLCQNLFKLLTSLMTSKNLSTETPQDWMSSIDIQID